MKQAREMAEEAGTNIPTVRRMCEIQMRRENIRAATPDEYYRQTIAIPLLDQLLMELTNRFKEHTRKATLVLCSPVARSRRFSPPRKFFASPGKMF